MTGTGAKSRVVADVEWTFPLEFVEVVWGDGKTTGSQVISATDLPAFGQRRFEIPFDAAGKKTANAVFVKVVHNGKVIHENYECTGPTRGAKLPGEAALGPILIQGDHGPVAYRNLKLTPQ